MASTFVGSQVSGSFPLGQVAEEINLLGIFISLYVKRLSGPAGALMGPGIALFMRHSWARWIN